MNDTKTLTCIIFFLVSSPTAHADTFGEEDKFDIEFVTIGHPDNADATHGRHPVGKVEYPYRIAKYEISRGMIEQANREGGLDVTMHPLDQLVAGGERDEMPASGTSWFEAMAFVNWLNESRGFQPAYRVDRRGNFQLWSSSEAWQAGSENLFRHKDAYYFLPSVDEWYKAAFYDADTGDYFDWATDSNTVPTAVTSGTAPGTAVFNHPLSQGPADITLAGGLSAYGTMGQAGNAFEWVETEYDLVNDVPFGKRDAWGGWWGGNSTGIQSWLSSSYWGFGEPVPPTVEFVDFGFRIASVPEPNAMLLTIWACAAAAALRTKRSSIPLRTEKHRIQRTPERQISAVAAPIAVPAVERVSARGRNDLGHENSH